MATDQNSFLFKQLLKMKLAEMTPAQRNRASKPKPGNAVRYPYRIEKSYAVYINKLMRIFTSTFMAGIAGKMKKWIKSDRADLRVDDFNEEFQMLISELQGIHTDVYTEDGDGWNGYNYAAVMGAILGYGLLVSKQNTTQIQRIIKNVTGVENFGLFEGKVVPGILQNWQTTNFQLIKSLSDEYIKKVNTIVSEAVLNEETVGDVYKKLRAANANMTGARARLIARDQVGKLYGALTKQRQQSLGISMYGWLTAGDERVRASHKALSTSATGYIYKWGESGVYSPDNGNTWKPRTGKMAKAIPGQEIQCRCSSYPIMNDIFTELSDEIDNAL